MDLPYVTILCSLVPRRQPSKNLSRGTASAAAETMAPLLNRNLPKIIKVM